MRRHGKEVSQKERKVGTKARKQNLQEGESRGWDPSEDPIVERRDKQKREGANKNQGPCFVRLRFVFLEKGGKLIFTEEGGGPDARQ